MESMEDSRRRFDLRHQLQQLSHQRAQRGRARQVGAIGGQIHAGQHDLGKAFFDQPPRFRHHRAHRHAARIAPAIGNDAEGAAMVAAILHLQEGAGLAVEMIHHLRRGFAHAHDVVDADAFGARPIAEIGIGLRRRAFPDCPAPHPLPAWRHRSAGSVWAAQPVTMMRRAGPFALQPADRLARLAHRFGGHGAGIDHHGVAQLRLAGARLDRLALIGVEAAAEGDDFTHGIIACPDPARRVKRRGGGPVISTWPSSSRHSMMQRAAIQYQLRPCGPSGPGGWPPRRWRRRRCRRPG